MDAWTVDAIGDLTGKRCLITGANSGIGFETARVLAKHGAQVMLACRSPERGQAAKEQISAETKNENVSFLRLDLADLKQVRECAAGLVETGDPIDVLVNNAGLMMPPLGRTKQGFELQFGVNHLGHFALTGLLLPLLEKSDEARIVNVASNAHKHGKMDFSDLNYQHRGYNRITAYGQSKLANLLFSLELDRRIREQGLNIRVLTAHPGWTSTNLMKYFALAKWLSPRFAMTSEQGAQPTLRAVTDPGARSGEYFGPDGPLEMWGLPTRVKRTQAAQNRNDAKALWGHSTKLTGTRYLESEAIPDA